MERVRSKAQGSIDQANLIFQAKRHELTIHVDNIVAFMQQQFLNAQGRNQARPHDRPTSWQASRAASPLHADPPCHCFDTSRQHRSLHAAPAPERPGAQSGLPTRRAYFMAGQHGCLKLQANLP